MSKRPRYASIKNRIRSIHRRCRQFAVDSLFSYSSEDLVAVLHDLGLRHGDSVLLHSAFEDHFGFRGSPEDIVEAFVKAIGKDGNLLMASMPYGTSSLEYLSKLKRFDVRKTPSAMGLVSEFFRRRTEVVRSASPLHPILILGPKAAWFAEGHERCEYSCGAGSVFDKLLRVGGKVAFFNVSFAYFTFFHYLEHRVGPHLNFNIYHDPAFQVDVVDATGSLIKVPVYAFSQEVHRRRRFAALERWLSERKLIHRVRIGASYVLLVDLKQVVEVVDEMTAHGDFFYDLSSAN